MKKIIFTLIISLFFSFDLVFSQTKVEMFVSSRNTNSVKKYDGETGEYLGDFVKEGAGGLSKTQDVKFGPDGNLYSTGIDNYAILKFDGTTGEFLGEFTSDYELLGPTKFTFHSDGLLYVSQWGPNKKILRFDGVTGEFVDEFATTNLDLACGQAWDAEGNLFVADYGLQNISFFGPNGESFGFFVDSGLLEGPVNVWFRDNGNLIVLDWTKGEALEFEYPTGNYINVYLSGLDRAEGFAYGPDSNLYVCDWISDQVLKYDTEGNFIEVFAEGGGLEAPNAVTFRVTNTTSVDENESLPNDVQLHQNYPNPFNPSTTIEFSIPNVEAGHAPSLHTSLIVYDILGREIKTLLNKQLQPGEYEIEFDANELPSGVYFYRLNSSEFTESRKMILLR